MRSTCSSDPALAVYYGRGGIEALARHRRVVLQPGHHARAELARLAARGTEPLAYLALSEDTGPPGPWSRPARNAAWGGRYVDVAHPEWVARIVERAGEALASGYAGLFLDTLDVTTLYPEDRAPLLDLVRRLRERVGDRYLLANRGFDLLPELGERVDGFLFEAFSTTWEGGYRPLPPAELAANVERLHLLQATGRDVHLLDYADRPDLLAFARSRARTHALPLQVSNRELTLVR